MSTRHRRMIRRPDGVDDAAWSRLGDLLAAAVEQQRRLAADCPHILAPLSDLKELDDGSLAVEHEPANPLATTELFDPQATGADSANLLRVSAGLFDALAAAHDARPDDRPTSHGGICPGTILIAPDGQTKLADFGFAPAICQALGTDAYVNLAVAPGSEPGCPQPGPSQPGQPQSVSDDEVTGIWEVLDPHTFDRDDRICGFIDPEKYGSRALGTFEAGSDIIAAGFVLHLMAEHQHAYLYTDPDAHRLVEMSQFMGMGRYNGARRQDLRESSDPAVRLWCDLIAKTLSRLPKNRPTAAEIARALSGQADAEQVAAVLERKVTVAKPRTPERTAARAEDRPSESPTREATVDSRATLGGGKKKPVLPVVIGLAVVAIGIGAWQFWPAGETGPPSGNDPAVKIVRGTQNGPGPEDDSPRTPADSANDNASVSPTDHRLVETDPPPQHVDGPPDHTTSPPQAINENASTPAKVVSKPENGNQAPTANDTLIEEGAELTRKVTRLEERLDRPTHQALTDIITGGSIDALREEVRDYWGRAHDADAIEQSKTARDQVGRLGEWSSKIAAYARVLDMAGKPLDQQVRLLEAAQADWPTAYVEDLIAGLPAVADLLAEADRQLGRGEWRRARFVIDQAKQKSIEQKLGDQLAPIITAAGAKLAADRRDQLADAFDDAAQWLARIGDPPDPIAHLARTEDAAAARNQLDRFDLDFPTGALPRVVATKAVSQNLLPWTGLTDEEQATLEGLIDWTTFDLPVGESTLSLVFVQAAPATGMLDPVWIGQTEVTVGLYREVTGALPQASRDKKAHDVMRSRDDNPVAFVTADQVRPFCGKMMSLFDNRIIVRPPSKSQWTHALSAGGLVGMDAAPQLARFAGTEGDRLELDPRLANFESDENYFTFAPGHLDGFGHCAPVRSYPPNRWLIYDMLGNLSEWVTTTSASRLSAVGGSYVDKHTADHRAPSTRDQTIDRADIGIRLVVTAAP